MLFSFLCFFFLNYITTFCFVFHLIFILYFSSISISYYCQLKLKLLKTTINYNDPNSYMQKWSLTKSNLGAGDKFEIIYELNSVALHLLCFDRDRRSCESPGTFVWKSVEIESR